MKDGSRVGVAVVNWIRMEGEISRSVSLDLPPQTNWDNNHGLAVRERKVIRSLRFWTVWVWLALSIVWLMLGLCVVPNFLSYASPFFWNVISFMGIGAAGAFFYFVFQVRKLPLVLTPRDHALASDLDREGEWLVEMRIYQNGFETGSDRGILMVDDSSIAFSGHRTWFSLSGADLYHGAFKAQRYRIPEPELIDQCATVWLKHPSREVSLGFFALSEQYVQVCVQMRIALEKLSDSGEDNGAIPRAYPPLSPDPELHQRGLMRSVWFLRALYGCVLLLLPLAANRSTTSLGLLLMGCSLGLAIYGTYCRRRHMSFLRKLDTLEPRTTLEQVRVL